jgi:FixJ family two-component response regulator
MRRTAATKQRVLIVDDECAETIARLLRPRYDTLTATTFEEGQHALATVDDLAAAILDVHLRDRSGLDLLADLRSSGGPNASVPVLVVTGHVTERHANPAFDLGADFVEKPVTRERIERFLSKASSWAQRLERRVGEWAEECGLTMAEQQVLLQASQGESREAIAATHASRVNTVKKHVSNMLQKTGDDTLQQAVNRLLRSVLSEGAAD